MYVVYTYITLWNDVALCSETVEQNTIEHSRLIKCDRKQQNTEEQKKQTGRTQGPHYSNWVKVINELFSYVLWERERL